MQTTETNPLGLNVFLERAGDLIPFHGITRPDDLAAITASMAADGWQGAPLVVDNRNFLDDDDIPCGGYLLTGTHRHRAAIDTGTGIPCVSMSDLAAALGIDLDDYDYGDGTEWEQVFAAVPAEIRDAYGIDL